MKITVDAKHAYRKWPHVEKFQNTTLRYTPSSSFPEVMEKVIGRPSIIRLFVTLDEVWDYRTDTYHWDYPIGVNPYIGDKNHYAYDWPLTVPSPVNAHIQEYLISHSAYSDEVLLNLRRYERETVDGVITYEQYERVFEKVVEYYKDLCPNITYIECCNEVELPQFGNLNMKEYYKLYKCACRGIQRLNQKHNYKMPLKIGGFGMSSGISHWSYWQEFLELLSKDENRSIDFYSMHEYHTNPQRIMEFYMRHQEIIHELKLPDLPLLMTEYGLRVGLGDAGRPTNIQNSCGEIAGMILASHCPSLKIFPWCTFHNPNQQLGRTMFILNEANEYLPTPNAHAMTMFKMLGEHELMIEEYLENKVVATIDEERICVLISNPGQAETEIELVLDKLENGSYDIHQYMVSNDLNNCLTNPSSRSLQATKELNTEVDNHKLCIYDKMIGNAFCLWTIKLHNR
ncbi:hypothetical protein JK636_17710 [Clostridium sp. YIM B02515]|uniref:Glycosyl hydrolases family 39 N-terminal catalytic domain-containing protein n=1 Tax=Clostridium rhizosphaerae TaxID=2803861 RepID=A0ABS1TE91_9CLOT|nr:hypothetical protein [Clostridium rhizosphaerae]MBL4937556.1 hypothetical protein [Clostridium rhizosphaerae]